MARLQISGDALTLDGYAVGRLSSSIPSSVRGQVEELLELASNDTTEANISNGVDIAFDDFIADVNKAAKSASQAGMVELGELSKILIEAAKSADAD